MELVYTNTAIDTSKKIKAKVITITSGKGGVGKTSIATNLALSLSALGKKVCVFDADASLANINILLGIHPEYTLHHLLTGEQTLKQIMVDGPRGLKVIPGATGIAEYAQLSVEQKEILIRALDELQQQFDYLIIDTAAGIGDDVLDFVKASQFSIIIITPEPTSLTDSFSLLKVLKRSNFDRTSYILVNMAMDFENSQTIYRRFESAVKKYIKMDIAYLGFIQVDETVISSVSLQCPAVLLSPDCIASRCFKTLAKGLEEKLGNSETESFSEFWIQQKPSHNNPSTVYSNPHTDSLAVSNTNTISQQPLDFASSVNYCSEQLAKGELDKDYVISLLEPLMANYSQSYSMIPPLPESEHNDAAPSARDFYSFIEQDDFSKEALKEIIHTLEKIYIQRNGNGIRDFENNVIYLFSQFNGKQDDLDYLHQQLIKCYERHFDKPLYNVFEAFEKNIQLGSYSLNDFDNLLDNTLNTYQQRFAKKYRTHVDIELENALATIEQLQNKSNLLNEELELSQKAQHEQNTMLEQIELLLSKGHPEK